MDIDGFYNLLDDLKLVESYGKLLTALKTRGIIRTKNVVGELGEYVAIKFFSETSGCPKLQAAPPSTRNIDAISTEGLRYSIKSTTGKVTGVFYGLNDPHDLNEDEKKFEYIILVLFENDLSLKGIYQLDWKGFLKHKRWHSRMRAWNLSVNKRLLNDCTVVYSVC